MNKAFMVIGYFPIALILTIFYLVCNLIMLPFAYLASLLKKLQLLLRSTNKYDVLLDFIFFFAFGWLMLMFSVLKDSKDFFVHLYNHTIETTKMKFNDDTLTLEEFTNFEAIIDRICKNFRKKSDEVMIPVKQIALIIRSELEVEKSVKFVIFNEFKSTDKALE